ncbi:glycosyltransferase family 2 protein [Lysobacter gummosus]|jgi:dolichol-phosphate mannosyltransferase|uniref:Glycosyltransferase family 2 protein n=1 Tax=Lysobacter gummosus TaxID=262324 RepID=A0ABY3X7R7_9GAMM|nr:glycosyltransferase family 2 protein [Lysobacter gummosus]ALN93114.1 glycosyl transferase 2 family protein [Lysobacter gummosus]UNP28623.1 glycosyltransferase family 2 protein [Lysobacter gummosus]
MKSLQILCPVFREEEIILEFHERLREAVRPLRERYSIAVTYALDPAPDRTEEILLALAERDPEVRVLVMSRRFGHQAALMAGIDTCQADALIMLDSDGQHPPELIPRLVEAWEGGSQIVQTMRRDGNETGFLKRSTSAMFYRLISRIGSIELQSGAADYRLLDRAVVQVIRDRLPETNIFLRGIVAWVGYRISFIEFEPLRRLKGASKYRPSVLVNFAIQGISSFSKTPLRLCTITGLFVAMLSMLAAAGQMAAYFLFGHSDVQGWASLMTFVSLLGGVQLFFMGILGEYLGQIFDEVKRRPRYLIRTDSAARPDASPGAAAQTVPGPSEHV